MNIKTHLASLVVVLTSSTSLISATETERLRALCAEQEMQIRQLEEKITQLTDTPPSSRHRSSAPVEVREVEAGVQIANYTVVSGDSMERIARHHSTTATALAKLNGMEDGAMIHPGQKLKVLGKTFEDSAHSVPSVPAKAFRTHTVTAGDTFYKISMKFGVSVDELIALNAGVSPTTLRIGQKINLERVDPAVTKAPVTSLAPDSSIPVLNTPAPIQKLRALRHPIRIEKEITYGQFAANYGATSRRLDELNGFELDPSTVLAQGSELYIPAQP